MRCGRREPQSQARRSRGRCDAGVLEIVDDFDGDTYRAADPVRFRGVVYMLHALQKKSRKGIATPKLEMTIVGERLKRAKEEDERWRDREPATSR